MERAKANMDMVCSVNNTVIDYLLGLTLAPHQVIFDICTLIQSAFLRCLLRRDKTSVIANEESAREVVDDCALVPP